MIMVLMKLNLIFLLLFAIIESSVCSDVGIEDWDYLMFSQRWPITACMIWEEENTGHKCNLPTDISQWIVHGIWPTKTGTNGPNTCNSAIHFDPDQLQPIEDEMVNHWTNIEAGTSPTSFWKHEWHKHGTCASILPTLNSVFNYFNKGLELNKQYNLSSILAKGKITPNTSGYAVDDIYNAIKSVLNKNPTIECEVDRKTKDTLISEIHICLDKSFNVIDCTPQMSTDCSQKKAVMYLASLPQSSPDDFTDYGMDYGENEEEMMESQRMFERGRYLLQFYRFIKFLMWFTL